MLAIVSFRARLITCVIVFIVNEYSIMTTHKPTSVRHKPGYLRTAVDAVNNIPFEMHLEVV